MKKFLSAAFVLAVVGTVLAFTPMRDGVCVYQLSAGTCKLIHNNATIGVGTLISNADFDPNCPASKAASECSQQFRFTPE